MVITQYSVRIALAKATTASAHTQQFIARTTFFVGANTPRIVHGRNYPLELKPFRIKFGARIGIDVSVLPGVTIGREALVGAGSLVTKDVPDYAVVFGRPAKVVRNVSIEERLF